MLDYVRRYTHRVAIANQRLIDLDDGHVRFRYKDYRAQASQTTMTLDATEFIRRVLLHVLPSGFHRIRYDGLLGHRHRREHLARCRHLLGTVARPERVADAATSTDYRDRYEALTGCSLRVCPRCHDGQMRIVERLAGVLRIEQPGLVVVGYRSRHSFVEQKPEAFDAYLAEEGLERIAAVRATQKQPPGLVRELFSRCAKALLVAGPGRGSGHDRVLGFTLELVPEKNPYAMRVGAALPVRLLYNGQPLAGALVVAMNRGDPATKVRARSGADGRVSLRLSREGAWLIKAVHMIPAAAGSGAHWESLWASLTFELAGPPAARPVKKPAQ